VSVRTAKMQAALELLRRYDEPGVYAADYTATIDGQPWINWRTADALERRGLVTIDHVLQEVRLADRRTDVR
jgi:hypothetical protein